METFESRFEASDYNRIIASRKEFNDKEFPSKSISLGNQKEIQEVAIRGLTWKRPAEIFRGKYNIFSRIDINNILQGSLGNCYFLSAISGLAEMPHRIKKLVLTHEKNESGCYAIELFVCGIPRTIVVDDKFPYIPSEKRWAFTHSLNNDIWMMLIEKAWAKAHGSYGNTDGGDPRESFSALTGAPTVLCLHNKISKADLWNEIHKANKKNYIMTTGGGKEIKGIIESHSYSVLQSVEVPISSNKTEKLVLIRNPWGDYEWTGDWSKKSPLWTPRLKKLLKYESKNEGCFYMKFDDYFFIFSHTFICKVVDDFVHQNVTVKEHEAIVAFKIDSPIKGFFSINHLTPRMMKSLGIKKRSVGPQRKGEILVLEMHKYENNTFIAVLQAQRLKPPRN